MIGAEKGASQQVHAHLTLEVEKGRDKNNLGAGTNQLSLRLLFSS